MIGAAVWPRGGGGEVRRAGATGLRAGAAAVRDTIAQLVERTATVTAELRRLAALFDHAYVQFRTEPAGPPSPDWLLVLVRGPPHRRLRRGAARPAPHRPGCRHRTPRPRWRRRGRGRRRLCRRGRRHRGRPAAGGRRRSPGCGTGSPRPVHPSSGPAAMRRCGWSTGGVGCTAWPTTSDRLERACAPAPAGRHRGEAPEPDQFRSRGGRRTARPWAASTDATISGMPTRDRRRPAPLPRCWPRC